MSIYFRAPWFKLPIYLTISSIFWLHSRVVSSKEFVICANPGPILKDMKKNIRIKANVYGVTVGPAWIQFKMLGTATQL